MFRPLLAAAFVPFLLTAQIHVTASAVVASHGGHALAQDDPDNARILPGPGLGGALSIGLDRGPWRAAVILERQGAADLQIIGNTAGVLTRDVLIATTLGVDLGVRAAGRADAAALYLLAGFRSTRWKFQGVADPTQSRTGAALAVEGSAPVGSGLSGLVRADAMLSGGLFEASQLPEGYQAEPGRRFALMVGIRWHR